MFGDLWLYVTALLLLIGALSGRTVITVLGMLVFLTDGVTRLWSYLSLRSVTFEHEFSESRAFHGEHISMEIRLNNHKLLPLLWLEMQDQVPEELPLKGAELMPSHLSKRLLLSRTTTLAPYERVTWRYGLTCALRGMYWLGPAMVRAGDLFGMFPRRYEVAQSPMLLIYPRMVPLGELGLPERRPFGDVRSRERIFQDPSRIAGVREYRPSDPLKHVDWKATARRQDLQVKQFEPSTTLHLLVLLNIDTLEHSWEGYIPELLERAITSAASVARHAFDRRWAVGLIANGSLPQSEYPIRIPPNRSADQLIHILEALAGVIPLTTATLAELIEEESHRFPWGTTIVCVASLVSEALWAALARLHQAGHPVTVLNVAQRPLESLIEGLEVINLATAPAFSAAQ